MYDFYVNVISGIRTSFFSIVYKHLILNSIYVNLGVTEKSLEKNYYHFNF